MQSKPKQTSNPPKQQPNKHTSEKAQTSSNNANNNTLAQINQTAQ